MRPTQEDERRIRAQALVREWTRSGLLDPSQGAALGEQLRVDVRRTNVFLRVGLALFTALIISASVMLIVVVLDLDDAIPSAIVTGISAVACVALAQHLVARRRFYRFGVEEALAVGSAALTDGLNRSHAGNGPLVAGLLVGAGGGFGIYLRFGYVYAVIGAMACAAAIRSSSSSRTRRNARWPLRRLPWHSSPPVRNGGSLLTSIQATTTRWCRQPPGRVSTSPSTSS